MPPLKLTKSLALSFALGAVLSIASDTAITRQVQRLAVAQAQAVATKTAHAVGAKLREWAKDGVEAVREEILKQFEKSWPSRAKFMILKFTALSCCGGILAVTAPTSPTHSHAVIEATLFTLCFCLGTFNLAHAFRSSDFNRYKTHSLVVGLIYITLALTSHHLVKRLYLIDKNTLTAIAISFLIFLVADKSVQFCADVINEPCFIIVRFIQSKVSRLLNLITSKDVFQIPEQKLNAADLRVTAVHEAGHALMHGVLDYFPESLSASINKQALRTAASGAVMVGGRVRVLQENRAHHYQPFIEWEMLFSLAGQEGEKALNGLSSMGASSDIESWYCLAKYYLSSGCSRLLYFPSPETGWEEKTNRKSLEIMLDRQRKILSRFFRENRYLLEELSELLSDRERLNADELKPILQKVVRTPGLPTVLKEYSPHI